MFYKVWNLVKQRRMFKDEVWCRTFGRLLHETRKYVVFIEIIAPIERVFANAV